MINKIMALTFVFGLGLLIGSSSYANQEQRVGNEITSETIRYELCVQELMPKYSMCRASWCGPHNVRRFCSGRGGPLARLLQQDNNERGDKATYSRNEDSSESAGTFVVEQEDEAIAVAE